MARNFGLILRESSSRSALSSLNPVRRFAMIEICHGVKSKRRASMFCFEILVVAGVIQGPEVRKLKSFSIQETAEIIRLREKQYKAQLLCIRKPFLIT